MGGREERKERKKGNQTLLVTFILGQNVFQIFVKISHTTIKQNEQTIPHAYTKSVVVIRLLFLISLSFFPVSCILVPSY